MVCARIWSVVLAAAVGAAAQAGPIAVSNFSFESPAVVRDTQNPFGALPFIDDWDETTVGLHDEFDQNTGVFINTDPTSPDYITNAHLERLAFVSSLVGNDLRQELAASFVPGAAYSLTVAVGKSFTFPVGDDEELEIALYYLDGNTEHVVGSTRILGMELGTTELTDFQVNVGPVDASDPWAGHRIGVLIRPWLDDVDDELGEGFWNIDNVRVVPEPGMLAMLVGVGLLAARRGRPRARCKSAC